ncbi:MAG: hypothetical protein IJ193_02275 [Bacilli bacterium]|nr:hypothetical protein [Bacilli bacterium]
MKQDLIGISEGKIDQLILDSYDYIERLNTILNNISTEINNTSNCLECEAVNELKRKYEEQKAYFSIFSSRLVSYTEKLLDVKNKSLMKSSEIATQVLKDSKNIDIVLPKK